MYIACSPITWQVRRQPDGPYAGREGYEKLLDEVQQAGYAHIAGGWGSFRQRAATQAPTQTEREDAPPAPQEVLTLLQEHGLKPAPEGTGGSNLLDASARDAAVEQVRPAAQFTRALGLDALFIMPPGARQRTETAGHYPQGHRPDSLTEEQNDATCETLNRMGEACREVGVWLALHNHAGMYWETDEEFERVIAGTDPALVGLGPDVGHMVWGGIDPLPWFRRHMDRVKSIHIKDMNAGVLRRCREEKLTYRQTSDLGVFAEIGEGCVDWPALFGFWREAGYNGAVIVETDRTTKPTAAQSATISRRYLSQVIGV
jgi:inosose dehydratase